MEDESAELLPDLESDLLGARFPTQIGDTFTTFRYTG